MTQPLHPEIWAEIVKLRDRYPDRPESDRPEYLTVGVGEDGFVVRPLSLADIFEWVERECQGDVA